MILIEIKFVKEESMCGAKLFDEKSLNYAQPYILERRQEWISDLFCNLSLLLLQLGDQDKLHGYPLCFSRVHLLHY